MAGAARWPPWSVFCCELVGAEQRGGQLEHLRVASSWSGPNPTVTPDTSRNVFFSVSRMNGGDPALRRNKAYSLPSKRGGWRREPELPRAKKDE